MEKGHIGEDGGMEGGKVGLVVDQEQDKSREQKWERERAEVRLRSSLCGGSLVPWLLEYEQQRKEEEGGARPLPLPSEGGRAARGGLTPTGRSTTGRQLLDIERTSSCREMQGDIKHLVIFL